MSIREDKFQPKLAETMSMTESSQLLGNNTKKLPNRYLLFGHAFSGMCLSVFVVLIHRLHWGETWQWALGCGVRFFILYIITMAALCNHLSTRRRTQYNDVPMIYMKECLAEFFRPSLSLWLWLLSLPATLVIYCLLSDLNFPRF